MWLTASMAGISLQLLLRSNWYLLTQKTYHKSHCETICCGLRLLGKQKLLSGRTLQGLSYDLPGTEDKGKISLWTRLIFFFFFFTTQDIKTPFPNLGQFWRFLLVSDFTVGWVESSFEIAVPHNLSLYPILFFLYFLLSLSWGSVLNNSLAYYSPPQDPLQREPNLQQLPSQVVKKADAEVRF